MRISRKVAKAQRNHKIYSLRLGDFARDCYLDSRYHLSVFSNPSSKDSIGS